LEEATGGPATTPLEEEEPIKTAGETSAKNTVETHTHAFHILLSAELVGEVSGDQGADARSSVWKGPEPPGP